MVLEPSLYDLCVFLPLKLRSSFLRFFLGPFPFGPVAARALPQKTDHVQIARSLVRRALSFLSQKCSIYPTQGYCLIDNECILTQFSLAP
jgi:hypothetical protein